MELTKDFWRQCSSCKKNINYHAKHYVCSVSTCTRKRTGLVFCCVSCWERHLPGARHRDAAAVEELAPSYEEWKRELEGTTHPVAESQDGGARRIIVGQNSPSAPTSSKEILVVVSKLKAYIRSKSDMNTSDAVMDLLSDRLRIMCDIAIDKAREEGRKTVLDRDFRF